MGRTGEAGNYLPTIKPINHLPIDHQHLSITESKQTANNIQFPFAFLALHYYPLHLVLIFYLPSMALSKVPLSRTLTATQHCQNYQKQPTPG